MPTLRLSLKDRHCLPLRDRSCMLRVMLQDKAGKWITYNQAYIKRQAGVKPCHPTWAVQSNDMIRVPEDQVPCTFKRYRLFRLRERQIFLHRHQPCG